MKRSITRRVWPALAVDAELLSPWQDPSEFDPQGRPGLLQIGDTVYMVTVLTDLAKVAGYRATNSSSGKVYDIDATERDWTCDCPDGQFRQNRIGGCKHVRGVRLALAAMQAAGKLPSRCSCRSDARHAGECGFWVGLGFDPAA